MVIFDVTTDPKRTPIIQKRIKSEKTAFRTKWGLYGTESWLNSLKQDGIVKELKGKITDLVSTGHDDFPEFRMETENGIYQFERLGIENEYEKGKLVTVMAVQNKYILPISGMEDHLTPLRIEIE
ncbi:MAG: hypothetical protein NXI10_09175 [bacterium]|nr:hypothetical protein [bacterium]